MQFLNNYLALMLTVICFNVVSHLSADEKLTNYQLTKQAEGYANISNAQLKKMIEDDVLIVDIRREEEWQHTGIIAGSKTITFFDKQGRINQDFLPKFTALAKKNRPVVLICHSGVRTKLASQAIAQQLGYTNVINVTDGIMGWLAEKRPVIEYSK